MRLRRHRKPPFFGLSGRVLVAVVGAVAVIFAGLAFVSVQALENSTQNTLNERLALVKITAGRFDDFVDQTIRVTQTMIEATGLSSGVATVEAHEAFARTLNDHLGDASYYVAIIGPDFRASLVHPAQDVVLTYDFATSNCVNHAFEQAVPQVTRSFTIGTPTPAVSMVVPIVDPNGRVIEVVMVTLDLNAPSFVNLLQPRELGKSGIIEIVDRTGIILGATRPELRWLEDDHKGFFETLILERRTSVGTCHNCHDATVAGRRTQDLVAFAPLSVAPWGIAFRESRDEAFIHTDTLRRRLIIFGLLTLAVVGAATLALTRHLVRPLAGLTAACSDIADGHLDAPLPARGPGEVGVLGEAFEVMRQRLKMSLAQIRDWNNQLEGLVSQRNQELEVSRQELIEANRDLSTLNALSQAMAQSVDLQETLATALRSVVELTGMKHGWICLFEGDVLHMSAALPESSRDQGCLCDPSSMANATEQCIAEGCAVITQRDAALPVCEDEAGAEQIGRSLISVPLVAKGVTVGLLWLVPAAATECQDAELALFTSIGSQVGIAVQNALLYRTLLEEEDAQSELLRKLISAQEEERRRIARELHDETSQALTALSMGIETAMCAPAQTPEDVRSRLGPMKLLSSGVQRELQRMIQDLRPSLLDDLGLIPAIDWYAEERLGGVGARVSWQVNGPETRLPTQLETTLFRIAQEAISNVAQHADAENVQISLEYLNEHVVLEIEDDGQGFDAGNAMTTRPGPGGYGLMGIRERVNLIKGTLLIESAPGEGTRICVTIPITGQKMGGNGHHSSTVG